MSILPAAATRGYDLETLMDRYHRRIQRRPMDCHHDLTDFVAVTFRPGDRTDSFRNKLLRPAGSAVMVVLAYEPMTDSRHKQMPLRGLRSQTDHDGTQRYGAAGSEVFHYNAGIRPRAGGRGRCLDPFRNPNMLELLLRLDASCYRRLQREAAPDAALQLPRTLLGFSPSSPPRFEDSAALRRIAARKLGVSEHRIATNDAALRDRLLAQVWEEQLIQPGQGINDTDLALIDARLCSSYRSALRIFEDFSAVVGVDTWNPARDVTPVTADNPAVQVLTEFCIDTRQDFCQYIPPDVIDAMSTRMRELAGATSSRFSAEEILDGLTRPNQPLTAWQSDLPQLRPRLPRWIDECVTDAELLRAAKAPRNPLHVAAASKTQVLSRHCRDAATLGLQPPVSAAQDRSAVEDEAELVLCSN